MPVLLSICALILISKISQPGECSTTKQAYFRLKKQKYLANHVIETKQTESEFECGMHCVGHRSCVSVNYKTSGVGKGLCELNSKMLQETSDAPRSMHNPEFNHLYIIKKDPTTVKYPDSRCFNCGKFVGGYGNRTSYYECSRCYGEKYCNEFCVQSLGCFNSPHGALLDLIVYFRDEIDWYDIGEIVRKCACATHENGYKYFAVRFYGECWGSRSMVDYNKVGPSNNCWQGVGKHSTSFVYKFIY